MPELPEVETMRRGVARLVGSQVTHAEVPTLEVHPIKYEPPPAELCPRLIGRHLEKVSRVGKRLLLHWETGKVLVIEPRMTGRVIINPLQDLSHIRLILHMENRTATQGTQKQILVFRDVRGLGSVRLLSEALWRGEFGPHKIGPDALTITWEELRARLSRRRCAIKVGLLDQSVLAGVGNIYASEALHRAKIHPALPCSQISKTQWQELTRSLREVLQEAIQFQGSTLADGAYAPPENDRGSYQDKHRVYQRDGQRCCQCRRGIVRRIILGHRSTFYCPICQRPRSRK